MHLPWWRPARFLRTARELLGRLRDGYRLDGSRVVWLGNRSREQERPMIWAMSFPEWFCAHARCRNKVRWADAALDEEDGKLYGVFHEECRYGW